MEESNEKALRERDLIENAWMETLGGYREYLEKRKEDLTEALTNGVGMDTWDPYLTGFSQGMKSGLEVAEDLVFSYYEWLSRDIPRPDKREYMKQ